MQNRRFGVVIPRLVLWAAYFTHDSSTNICVALMQHRTFCLCLIWEIYAHCLWWQYSAILTSRNCLSPTSPWETPHCFPVIAAQHFILRLLLCAYYRVLLGSDISKTYIGGPWTIVGTEQISSTWQNCLKKPYQWGELVTNGLTPSSRSQKMPTTTNPKNEHIYNAINKILHVSSIRGSCIEYCMRNISHA